MKYMIKLIILLLFLFSIKVQSQVTFSSKNVLVDTADGAINICVADIDGDNDKDILYGKIWRKQVVWLEDTNGLCIFDHEKTLITTNAQVSCVKTSDVNGNGFIDILLTKSSLNNSNEWYNNIDGLGNFGSKQTFGKGTYLDICDIDGDGAIDVFSETNTIEIGWHKNTDSLGSFGTIQAIPTDTLLPRLYLQCCVGCDIDGDGDNDVLYTLRGSSIEQLAWNENIDGLGTFGPQQVISTQLNYVQSTFTCDMDGDGDLDVLSTSRDDQKIAWYENTDGQGTFGPQQIIALNQSVYAIYACDIDNDGDNDVISHGMQNITWYENNGNGTSFQAHYIGAQHTIYIGGICASDLDNDGDLDIIVADIGFDEVVWYENNPKIEIISQPNNKEICEENNCLFSLNAKYAASYQWQLYNGTDFINLVNNNIYSGTTTDSMYITNAPDSLNSSLYRCKIYNNYDTIYSDTIRLTVNPIYLFSFSDTICGGDSILWESTYYNSTGIYYKNYLTIKGCDSIYKMDLTVSETYQNQEICFVTVDTIFNKNKIIWEDINNVGIKDYIIHKETSTNIYSPLDTVSIDSANYFIDMTSSPSAHSDLYKISILDTCNNTSKLSLYHKTINLTLSKYGDNISLNWEKYEVENNAFIPDKYYIYRGATKNNLTLLDSVTGSSQSYNDINVTNIYYYKVGIIKNGCDNSKSNKYKVYSNNENNAGVLGKIPLIVYPNPCTNAISIESEGVQRVELINTEGKKVFETSPNKDIFDISISGCAQGIYFLKVITKNGSAIEKIIIE